MAKPDNEKSLGQGNTIDAVSAATAVKPEQPPIKPYLNWDPQELADKTSAEISYSEEGPDHGLVSEVSWPGVNAKIDYLRYFDPKGKVISQHAVLTAPGFEDWGGRVWLDEFSATINGSDLILDNSRYFAFHTTVVRITDQGKNYQVSRTPR